MDWIKKVFFAVFDYFKKPETQALIVSIVKAVIMKQFGGVINPAQGLAVYGMVMERLKSRVGDTVAESLSNSVAQQIDKYLKEDKVIQTSIEVVDPDCVDCQK